MTILRGSVPHARVPPGLAVLGPAPGAVILTFDLLLPLGIAGGVPYGALLK